MFYFLTLVRRTISRLLPCRIDTTFTHTSPSRQHGDGERSSVLSGIDEGNTVRSAIPRLGAEGFYVR